VTEAHVAFASYSENLLPGDTNTTSDVFLFNVTSGTTSLISVSTNGSTSGSGYSDVPDISSTGRYVAFYSESSDLIGSDGNSSGDIFRRDTVLNTTALVSVSTNGTLPGNSSSYDPDITPDGRFIAFETTATDLFANDLNGLIDDIVLRDMTSNTVELISINGSGTGSGNNYSYDPVISDDARFVAFESSSTNLGPVDLNGQFDVYVRDRSNNTNILCSRNLTATGSGSDISYDPIISGNGQIVLFYSLATNLLAGDTNGFGDVFAYNTATHTLQRVSIGLGGEAANGESVNYTISADGRYVAFQSYATNLVANDSNQTDDVFLRDLVSGTTTLISANCNNGKSGNGYSVTPSISRDGNYVTFTSTANDLASGSFTGGENIFRYSRLSGQIVLVSHNRFITGGGNGFSHSGRISDDGGVIAFLSTASNLIANDNNNNADLFVWSALSGSPQPDLVMDKTANISSVTAGNNFIYTLALTNFGTASATSVTASDSLPTGVTFVSALASQGTVTNSGNVVTANLGSLPIGNGAIITITVNAVSPGSVTNTAIASAIEGDATPANNTDSVVVTINAISPPVLSIQPTNTSQIVITWPASTSSGFALETTTNLVPAIVWSPVTNGVSVSGTNKVVILNVNAGEPERYYRLKQ
jgi:uncharacterized repeat protein (TIGR01451 family)